MADLHTGAAAAGAAAPLPVYRPVLAFLWMLGAIVSFTLMAVAGRAVQVELSSFEVMFWRSLVGLGIVLALLSASRRGLAQVRTQHPQLHVARNVFHFTGQNLWLAALMLLPLGQLVALEFTVPLWLLLLAPLMLGERLTGRKVLAAALGFSGVLIVAQPGVQPVSWGHLAGLAAAVGFALNMVYTKKLMAYDSVLCVLFWMSVLQGLMGLGLSFIGGFTWPPASLWPWLAVVGVTGLTAHFSLTTALSYAPASTVAPMEFLRLPVISVVGMLVYAEALDPWVFVGAVVIFGSNYLTMTGKRDAPRPT
ncbi:MAG: DMT family transporter [Rhodobacteraceae bacterium]|nr:DMT family transporter [Paracoccaceae bacterium]